MNDAFFDDLNDLSPAAEPEAPEESTGALEQGLAKLASLVEDINRDLSTSAILERAMSAAIELTGAERGFLVLVSDRGEWTFRVARNMDRGEIEDAEQAASHTVLRRVIDGREPILINDVVGGSDLTRYHSIARMQVRSIMGAPLISHGKLLGAAYVDTSRLAGVFDQTSLRLFETFVQLAAIAIENARLMEAEQQAKTRYRELQEYLETVLQSQPHGVIISDSRYHVEYANSRARVLLAKWGVENGNFNLAHSNSPAGRILANLREFEQGTGIGRASLEHDSRTFAYSFFRVHHAAGEGRIGIILEDITPQTELQKKLIESEKRSTVNQLAGGIAHEINNSLQPVKGRVELLALKLQQAGIVFDDVNRDLETITSLSERIEKIARNLRHLTKPVEPNFEPLDLGRLLTNTVEIMENTTGTLKGYVREPTAGRTSQDEEDGARVPPGFKLVLDLEESLPPILGDAHALESAFINMIVNSSHALREKGHGTLTIRANARNGQVVVAVEDTGVGIPPDVLPHVFEPYFTTRGDHGGTGLGMSIIESIAANHNATLDLKSVFGEGTTLTLSFPILAEAKSRQH